MNKIPSLLVIFLFFISSFNVDQDENFLVFINHVNTLTLTFQNDKCGEWGGDREIITIYRKSYNGQLLADYSKEIKDCEKSGGERLKKETIFGIKLSTENQKLILESIHELAARKLSREVMPSHSGLYCEALLKDSSIVIRDFPAARWTTFEKLSQELKKK